MSFLDPQPIIKDPYATIHSEDFTEQIHIELEFDHTCNAFAAYNDADKNMYITVNNIVFKLKPGAHNDIPCEKIGFKEMIIDAPTGHDFQVEIYHAG